MRFLIWRVSFKLSGHSKWSSIKHKKSATDAKRGKVFTKITREIIVAARIGGGDEEMNPHLKTVMARAKAANMPRENIERAIKKGLGNLEESNYVELSYEAYAPGGVGLMIEVLTDNKNRTAADIRAALSKSGGQLASHGSVSYMFNRKGIILYESANVNPNTLFEAALEAGVEDIAEEGDVIEVIANPEEFVNVLESLQSSGFKQLSAELSLVPENTITLDNEGTVKVLRLIELLEDNDDIQLVASNLNIPDNFEMS